MSGATGLLESFLGAIQASLSVLLVMFYGGIAAWLGILDPSNTKPVSKVCVRMFLPALLITKIGSQLEAGSGTRYLVVVLWSVACHLLSFIIGFVAHYMLRTPDWTSVALMFNNTTSYPLLLIESLEQTGILQALIIGDESGSDAVERATSYFLVFATISNCLTFAVGPRLVDSEHGPEQEESDDDEEGDGWNGNQQGDENDEERALSERTSLMRRHSTSYTFFPSSHKRAELAARAEDMKRRAKIVPRRYWKSLSPRTKWWLILVSDFFNAPLLGAMLGAVIGLTPPLHRAFFSDSQDGGIFSAWLTASLKNIGKLFVPLPVIIAGVSLFASIRDARRNHDPISKLPWGPISFILAFRFIVWPVASIALVYLLASKTNVLGDDPILWFTMMLMPTGPPATRLVAMVQVSSGGDEDDEAIISKLLTISYLISPVLSLAVVGSLRASESAF
ncbi:Auxin efflux carrier [Pleurostoma richardsiae]|uniref:Auxin efflux carrier n=1 Tax=Pleurostoma richardsiae TaxID=41990 RepID=A0AA38RGL7_9PEZI|nr:Auxin efflux carrier [Pleurostoma richardsiae]